MSDDAIDRAAEVIHEEAHYREMSVSCADCRDAAKALAGGGLLREHSPEVEVSQNLHGPVTAVIKRDGQVIFDGVSRDALLLTEAHDRAVAAKALWEAADALPSLTEGEGREGTRTWRQAVRDAYSIAVEESQSALRARADCLAQQGHE